MEELISNLNGKKLTHQGDKGLYTIEVVVSDPKEMDIDLTIDYTTETAEVPENIFTECLVPVLEIFRSVDPDQVKLNVPSINIKSLFVFFGVPTKRVGVTIIERISDNVVLNKIKNGFTEVEKILEDPNYFTNLVGPLLPQFPPDFKDVYDTKLHVTKIVETLVRKIKTKSGEPLGDKINMFIYNNLKFTTDKIIKPEYEIKLSVYGIDPSIPSEETTEILQKIEGVLHRFGMILDTTGMTP